MYVRLRSFPIALVSLLAYTVKTGPTLIRAYPKKHAQEKKCGMKTKQSLSTTRFPICVVYLIRFPSSSETKEVPSLKKKDDLTMNATLKRGSSTVQNACFLITGLNRTVQLLNVEQSLIK